MAQSYTPSSVNPQNLSNAFMMASPMGMGNSAKGDTSFSDGVSPMGPGGLASPLGQPDPALYQQGLSLLAMQGSKTSQVSDGGAGA